MKIEAVSSNYMQSSADSILIFLFTGTEVTGEIKELDQALNGTLGEVLSSGDFSGKKEDVSMLYTHGAIPAKRIILVGLGEPENCTLDTFRRAAATGIKKAQSLKLSHVAANLPNEINELSTESITQAMTEGVCMALYHYHGQKSSDPENEALTQLDFLTTDPATVQSSIARGQAFASGTNLARDLVNLPPNIATPAYLATQAQALEESIGLKVTVLEKAQMQALKMGALLGVAQGSDTPPRFIIMEHNADKKDEYETLVLVGKGVTFDTGGYSIKTGAGMVGMKGDMGGGAAVIGAMKIIGTLQIPLHVVGLVPAADNMISGHAYRPQDVVTASNGKTIEIISTDAEGRLLLADALVYAQKYKPAAVVDIATLTGAIMIALGSPAAGLFSNTDALVDGLKAAGETQSERVWHMPIYEEYSKPLKSDTADLKNSGGTAGRYGGAGLAAYFLSNFVDYPWAHVDMAGKLDNDGSTSYAPKNSSIGYGARLLAQFVADWAS